MKTLLKHLLFWGMGAALFLFNYNGLKSSGGIEAVGQLQVVMISAAIGALPTLLLYSIDWLSSSK